MVTTSLVDLGNQPLSNAYIDRPAANRPELTYPLHPMVCEQCFLVQIGVFQAPAEIFSDYAYFSSYSTSWLEHGRRYVECAISRLELSQRSFVVETASNDGYLLKQFVERGICVLGIEPAANVALEAIAGGVPTRIAFFGAQEAEKVRAESGPADLMIANNVLAHVPDIHDFVEGFRRLLAPNGVATFEFPHLLPLLAETQFDTIYHEHFSYLSLLAVEPIFEAHDLRLIDVERLPTHGGSLRLWVALRNSRFDTSPSVDQLRHVERDARLRDIHTYRSFAARVQRIKRDLLRFLLDAFEAEESVAAYGAAAKGNTLLNYCGIRNDLISCVADRNPHKQGRYLPGSHIPVVSPQRLAESRPKYVLIMPWNLKTEIVEQISEEVTSWGGQLAVAIPELTIL